MIPEKEDKKPRLSGRTKYDETAFLFIRQTYVRLKNSKAVVMCCKK